MKIATNPKGIQVLFDEDKHFYKTKNKYLISGTTFVNKFFPKFNLEEEAKKYAEKYDLDVKDVKKTWSTLGKNASEFGAKVHFYAECLYKNKLDQFFHMYVIDEETEKYIQKVETMIHLFKKEYDFIDAEYIVFSEKLGIAGTIDLLLKKNDIVYIFDWKTNNKIDKNTFQKALPPIDDLYDNKFNKYALQLNLYKYLLLYEGYTKNEVKLALIHLTEDKINIIPIPDYQAYIKKMIGYHK